MLRKVTAILFFTSFAICHSFSQDMISGIVNHYLKVLSVGVDEVVYKDTTAISYFTPGDKVLLIQMTGVELIYAGIGVDDRGIRNSGTRLSDGNTGKYEILMIDEVIPASNRIIFTSNLMNTYNNGEKIQLVKVYESENNAIINNKLSARDWDGNTGGILALVIFDTLKFMADIDVSFQGFRGALPETDFTGNCRVHIDPDPDNYHDTVNFFSYELNRAGNKGEGTVSTSFPYTKGVYFAATGGGGGNGKFAGGGGGSNYGEGGSGGKQTNACVPDYLLTAMGGIKGDDYYNNKRIVIGGGGGSGVQQIPSASSKGGNGGGIVIIAAGVVQGNGYKILANGEAVTSTVNESGGGGGAGGTVLIDASGFLGSLAISAKGGKGGNTGTACTGAGGGGGGGVFWYSGTQMPAGYSVDASGGAQGTHQGGPFCNTFGTNGQPGLTYSSLILPLNGFLFNTIRGIDTICAGQQPQIITGSNPKGGDGNYTFKWEQSVNKVNWIHATGTGTNQRDFTPDPLFTTTYFRRIVNVGGINPQADTASKSVEIYVYPAITNNILHGTDTICYNVSALPVTGEQPTGGDGTNYTYQWQSGPNSADWTNTGSQLITNQPYFPGKLTATSYFRRYITSTQYCSGYSDTVKITVLPSITNNVFKALVDTVICQGQAPGVLRAEQPQNGDGSYSYIWQKKDAVVWSDIPSSNIREINIGPVATTTQYRRVVISGNDNACIDTSGIKTVTVLNAITNNVILTDSARYCEGDTPNTIIGSSPSGAAGTGSYSYKWLLNSGSGWNEITGATNINHSQGPLSLSVQFKRIVISGIYNACKDTTTPLNLTVIPAIVNNLGLTGQTICENNTPLPFNSPPATGGNGSYAYEWLIKPQGTALWSPAPGQNNLAIYSSPALSDSSAFARKVTSDICTHISNPVDVVVYKKIKYNLIDGNSIKYTCYNTSEVLEGSLPADGKPNDYTYLWQVSASPDVWTNATGKTPNQLRNFETDNLTTPWYYRRIALSPGTSPVCFDTSGYVRVLINELPTGNLISSEDTTCEGGSITLKYNVAGTHGPWNISFGNTSVIGSKETAFAGPDSISIDFTSSQDVRILSIIDDSSCSADLSGVTGLVNVKVFELPDANAGEDKDICANQYTLNATKYNTGNAGLWQTTIGFFNDSTLENAFLTINPFVSGTLSGWVKWTETNWRCSDSDSVFLTFYEQPTEVDAGTHKLLDFLFQTTLDARPPLIGSGKWTVSKGNAIFENDNQANTEVRSLDWDNILKWTVTNGVCPSIADSINIVVNNLKLSRGITPGSGTSGELFKIEIENAERIKLMIFNRLGQLVWESVDYTEGDFWDGTNNNNTELPEGTYFYILKVKISGIEKEFTFNKYIELVR